MADCSIMTTLGRDYRLVSNGAWTRMFFGISTVKNITSRDLKDPNKRPYVALYP